MATRTVYVIRCRGKVWAHMPADSPGDALARFAAVYPVRTFAPDTLTATPLPPKRTP